MPSPHAKKASSANLMRPRQERSRQNISGISNHSKPSRSRFEHSDFKKEQGVRPIKPSEERGKTYSPRSTKDNLALKSDYTERRSGNVFGQRDKTDLYAKKRTVRDGQSRTTIASRPPRATYNLSADQPRQNRSVRWNTSSEHSERDPAKRFSHRERTQVQGEFRQESSESRYKRNPTNLRTSANEPSLDKRRFRDEPSRIQAKNTRYTDNLSKETRFRDSPKVVRNRPLGTPFSHRAKNSTIRVAQYEERSDERRAKISAVPVEKIRLQKLLSSAGVGSRREIEDAMLKGLVTVNDKIATLGDKANSDDRIKFNGRIVTLGEITEPTRMILYHKPEGEIVSQDDPENRATVFDHLPKIYGRKWIAVGRLDINTSGLLIFTTNGDLANRLLHPRYQLEREYAVRILGELSDQQLSQLKGEGVKLEDGTAKFEKITLQGGEGVNRWYHITLREGRNREVRRVFEALNLTISRLIRVRFGQIHLPPRLRRGMMWEVPSEQVFALLKALKESEGSSAEVFKGR